MSADETHLQLKLPAPESPTPASEGDKDVEQERTALLQAVSGWKFDTLEERVAWILNHHAETRNSDIALQLKYWDAFESDLSAGEHIRKQDLYKLTRLTSITRARARIQNMYQLFLASVDVRKQRGTLSESEKEKALEHRPEYPVFAVYADESGKTGKHLIVGSMWCLHPPEMLKLIRRIDSWRQAHSFKDEFHFKTISEAKLGPYLAFADFLAENASVLSFKAISVERTGISNVDEALAQLYYILLVRGVEQEDASGRAPLPRGIQLWKDLEEVGKDKLFLLTLA